MSCCDAWVVVVEEGVLDGDEDLVGRGLWIGDVGDLQDLRPAVAGEHHGAHQPVAVLPGTSTGATAAGGTNTTPR